MTSLDEQSGDIAMEVNTAHEEKAGQMLESEVETIGASDQGMMFG